MAGGARLARWRNGGGADVAEEKVEAGAAFGRAHGARLRGPAVLIIRSFRLRHLGRGIARRQAKSDPVPKQTEWLMKFEKSRIRMKQKNFMNRC